MNDVNSSGAGTFRSAVSRTNGLFRRLKFMMINARRWLFVLVPILSAGAALAQQPSPSTQPLPGRIVLDVVVTSKSGQPVSGLQQQDFTVSDNKVPQTLTSFQAINGRQAPVEVVVVVDAVNTDFQGVAYERDQVDKFLRVDGGRLAHPTALAIVTDRGAQIQEGFSTDGNALTASLDQYTIGLRTIRRSEGIYGAADRLELSLKALRELVGRESLRPGRKIILWISPGWPLLTGPRIEIDGKQQQQLFADIVSLSTQLRQARITLYSIDPLGTADIGARTFYWQEFVKGVSKPGQAQPGDLGLEVLATQSGGVALNSSNDIASELQKCLADTNTYYEVSFDPAQGDQSREYHRLEVHIAKSKLTARTREGYYSEP
jgi:VWFA-related protein